MSGTGPALRWELLFADLSAELDASADAELESEIADQTRSARAQLRLVDRLRGSIDMTVDIRALGVGTVNGVLRGVGPDWCLVGAAGADYVVRLAGVLEIGGLATYSATPGSEGQVAERFTLAAVVRRLARDRAVVTLVQVDGTAISGTVEVAGADLLELSDRRADEPGWSRRTARAGRRTIPLESVAAIRH